MRHVESYINTLNQLNGRNESAYSNLNGPAGMTLCCDGFYRPVLPFDNKHEYDKDRTKPFYHVPVVVVERRYQSSCSQVNEKWMTSVVTP